MNDSQNRRLCNQRCRCKLEQQLTFVFAGSCAKPSRQIISRSKFHLLYYRHETVQLFEIPGVAITLSGATGFLRS